MRVDLKMFIERAPQYHKIGIYIRFAVLLYQALSSTELGESCRRCS